MLSLWGGLHAPGSNLGVDFVESQGPEVVKAYNEKVQRLINFRSPGQLHHGAMKVLPWFNVSCLNRSQCALAYRNASRSRRALIRTVSSHVRQVPETRSDMIADGTHYGYQVNQEKVQLLLNLLDICEILATRPAPDIGLTGPIYSMGRDREARWCRRLTAEVVARVEMQARRSCSAPQPEIHHPANDESLVYEFKKHG